MDLSTQRPSKEGSAVLRQSNRNHQFDLLRIVFATLVLLSHAPELTDGNTSRELLHRLTRAPVTFGLLGVYGFFLLSGYLILRSWLGNPAFVNFLRKRVLRIVPGYLVAVALSTIAVGLFAPGVPDFFDRIDIHFLWSVAVLRSPSTPPVLSGLSFRAVNGSLWTIGYEFRCYILVALLGSCGLLRRPVLWLIATVLLLPSLAYRAPFQHIHWSRHIEALIGQPEIACRLTAVYLVGGCFYLFRDRFVFRLKFALAASAGLVGFIAFAPSLAEIALVLFGSYLMFYLGQMHLPSLSGMRGLPDISYGIYLYGWPVESLWIWYRRGSPWVTFFASTVICFGLGWLSWHFVERPSLALKGRPTAPQPGG